VAYAGAAALKDAPDSALFGRLADALDNSSAEKTHVSQIAASAREVRAALARPIPRPEPLQPITATLAYGHLKPGGKAAAVSVRHKRKLPQQALEAMAMDVSSSSAPASRPVTPELHKVY
jgi:hypothetical protein